VPLLTLTVIARVIYCYHLTVIIIDILAYCARRLVVPLLSAVTHWHYSCYCCSHPSNILPWRLLAWPAALAGWWCHCCPLSLTGITLVVIYIYIYILLIGIKYAVWCIAPILVISFHCCQLSLTGTTLVIIYILFIGIKYAVCVTLVIIAPILVISFHDDRSQYPVMIPMIVTDSNW
jgi:hypothetical protein